MIRLFDLIYFSGLLLIGLLLIPSCNKNCESGANDAYEFILPVKLFPARDTFRIGDTIHVQSEFSDEVFDRNRQRTFLLEDFRFGPFCRIKRIDTTIAVDGLPDFYILLPQNQNFDWVNLTSESTALNGEYTYSNSVYTLNYSVIPKKIGLYIFFFSSSIDPANDRQDFPGRCSRATMWGICTLNGGGDNNVDFLSRSPDPHYNTWVLEEPEDRFHRGGGYCFYVVE